IVNYWVRSRSPERASFPVVTLLQQRRGSVTARLKPIPYSVAAAAPRIRPRLARDRDELPRIGPVAERELEHPVHAADLHLAVGNDQGVGRVEPTPTGAHDNLPDAVRGIGRTGGGLGREPRSEERRVGKEWGCRGEQYQE